MPIIFRKRDPRFRRETFSMMRNIFTLCCLGLLGAAGALVGACGTPGYSADGRLVWRSPGHGNPPGGDQCLDRQHSFPLLADANETDDTEELTGREKPSATSLANRRDAASPSPRAARFEAALQHRLANTLNALGVRLQI
jgi:hypothetical protein